MPGQDRCFRCGSVLDAQELTIDVHPPRMARWKRPLRDILRWTRRTRIVPEKGLPIYIPSWMSKKSQDCFLGLCLSIIPGLAHLVQGRFREIRWYFMAWVLSLITGLFFYGGIFGLFLLGLAIGLHAWIAIQHKLIRKVSGFGAKVISAILVLIALVLIYRAVPRFLFSGLCGAHTSLTIPYHNVRAGDFLLVRRSRMPENLLSRGSLVLIRPATVRLARRNRSSQRGDAMIAQVIGLAGEQVEIEDGVFIVNRQRLDIDKYPVPRWLRGRKFLINVEKDSYFVSSEYSVHAGGRGLDGATIRNTCVVSAGDIEGIAFMRWLPLSRRGFIRKVE